MLVESTYKDMAESHKMLSERNHTRENINLLMHKFIYLQTIAPLASFKYFLSYLVGNRHQISPIGKMCCFSVCQVLVNTVYQVLEADAIFF